MPWSKAMCSTLRMRKPRPTSTPQVAKTLASARVAGPLFCDLFANVHLHLEYEVDLERDVEVGDLGFSGF
jgi:hypothetical protein